MFCIMGFSDLSVLVIKLFIAFLMTHLHELTLAVANMWLVQSVQYLVGVVISNNKLLKFAYLRFIP